MPVKPNASMFLHVTDEQEILTAVNNFKGKYSTDNDGIDMYIVTKFYFYIVKPLTQTCNRSFKSGVFPDKMKVAKSFHYSNLEINTCFPTTCLCHFYHNFQKFYKNVLPQVRQFYLLNLMKY